MTVTQRMADMKEAAWVVVARMEAATMARLEAATMVKVMVEWVEVTKVVVRWKLNPNP